MVNITNNHSAKFEYKGMKTVGVTEYTTQTLSKHFEKKDVLVQDPKNEKNHIREMCTNKGMNIVGVTNYTK